jgi:DNA invertase Pin-like site-specific DNA recombinase
VIDREAQNDPAVNVSAVIYAAKSTEDTRGSIATQLADCREMAAREGWSVVETYQDEGVSAFSSSRGPGLAAAKQRAAQLAVENGASVLVVQHSDRLARGDGETADHLGEVYFWAKRAHVGLHSVQDDANFASVIYAALIGERNFEDSKRKSAATRAGVRRRVELGLYHGGCAPYGYRLARDRNDLSDRGTLLAEPAEAEIVLRIYAEYVAGAGDGKIAQGLNTDGVRPPRAKQWEKSQIANILKSVVYVGRVHLNREVFDGAHEAIVPGEMWQEAQRQRAARAARSGGGRGRYPSGGHLLTRGLLRCSCGAAMSPRTFRHRNGYEAYVCSRRRRTGGHEQCQQPQVPRALIDDSLLTYFEEVALDLEETRTQLVTATTRHVGETRALREGAEQEAQRAEERLTRVRRDYLDGKLTADEWHEFRDGLDDERQAADAEAKRMRDREEGLKRAAVRYDAEGEVVRQLAGLRGAALRARSTLSIRSSHFGLHFWASSRASNCGRSPRSPPTPYSK